MILGFKEAVEGGQIAERSKLPLKSYLAQKIYSLYIGVEFLFKTHSFIFVYKKHVKSMMPRKSNIFNGQGTGIRKKRHQRG